MAKRPVIFGACVLLIATSRVAAAQEGFGSPTQAPQANPDTPDAKLGEAREAFRLGAELARATRWDEARLAFERSAQLKPHPVTTYNIGFCNRAVGRPASALQFFQRALEEHASARLGVLPDSLLTVTRQYLSEASARVARVRLSDLERTSLLVDGHPLAVFETADPPLFVLGVGRDARPQVPLRDGVLLLDPGTHVFVASRPGFAELIQTRVLAASEQLELEFSFQPLAKPSASALGPREAATPLPPARKPIDRRFSYVGFAVGAAGLAVGAISGIEALRLRSVLNSSCGARGDECSQANADQISALHRAATISTVATAAGAVGVVAGVTLLLISPRPSTPQRAGLSLRLAANGVSLNGSLP